MASRLVLASAVAGVASAIDPGAVLCKLAENKNVEKKLVDAICQRQGKVPVDTCETGLTKVVDLIVSKECSGMEIPPVPELLCDIVKSKKAEDLAIDKICEAQSKIPADKCEAGLTKLWDTLASKECPSGAGEVAAEGQPVWPKVAFEDCGSKSKSFSITSAYYKQLNSTTMINGYDATVINKFTGGTFNVAVSYNGMVVASHDFDVCTIAATGFDNFPKCPWSPKTKLHVIDYNPVHMPPYGPFNAKWTITDKNKKEIFCMKTNWTFKPMDAVIV